MTKTAAIAELRKQSTWSQKKVVAIVNGISASKACDAMSPTKLGVGDMFYDPRINHPCLVVEDRGGTHLVIGLTTSTKGLSATKIISRYITVQYAYPMIQLASIEGMSENYIGSVDEEEAKRVKIAVFDYIRNSGPAKTEDQ